MSKQCWTPYLMAEKAQRQNIRMLIEENFENEKEEKNIYTVVSDLSGYIFIGEALFTRKTTFREKGNEEFLFEVTTKFNVSETYKGKLESEITVHGGKAGDYGCRYDFEPGVEYLVIANKIKDRLVTYYCEFIQRERSRLY